MANSTIIINKLTNNLNAYTVESNFKTQDIIHALINFNESNATHTDKISNPSTNEIFMFYTKDINKQNDWKCDGFKWVNDGASKQLPKSDPKIIVSYYFAVTRVALPDDYKGNY